MMGNGFGTPRGLSRLRVVLAMVVVTLKFSDASRMVGAAGAAEMAPTHAMRTPRGARRRGENSNMMKVPETVSEATLTKSSGSNEGLV